MGYAVLRPATAFALDKSGKATSSFKDASHLAFIRKLPSVVSGMYGCEACHIRTGSAFHNKKKTGGGQKSSDCWVLPLTPDEHRLSHSGSELEFWRQHGVDPFDLAIRLYEVSGDIAAGERIIARSRGFASTRSYEDTK